MTRSHIPPVPLTSAASQLGVPYGVLLGMLSEVDICEVDMLNDEHMTRLIRHMGGKCPADTRCSCRN